MWQWLGYNANKAILANTTNLETFSDISSLTPVSWSNTGGIQIVNEEYLNVISKVTAESKFYNNDTGDKGLILFELDRSADEAYIHGVVNIVIDNNNGTSLTGIKSLLKVDFVKNTQGVDSSIIGLSQDFQSAIDRRTRFYHFHKSSENKDYLVMMWGLSDQYHVKAQWSSLTCKNVTILNTPLTQAWPIEGNPSTKAIDGYIIVNNEVEYATSARDASYADRAHKVDNYHIVVGTPGSATDTIYFM